MAGSAPSPRPSGRGSPLAPPNRFDRLHVEPDDEHRDPFDPDEGERNPQTVFFDDSSRSVVSENDSPDIPFRYSINPYRGCEHGCSYCYARPSHEYLGLNAGIDFETKIFVKRNAANLFRVWLRKRKSYEGPVILSGVTDCYQPVERRLRITRGCIAVAAETGQPISIITKNALVTRDLDLLAEMAARRLVHVSISVTTLDADFARALEPRASAPAARLRAISQLAAAGVPVRVMAAPIIPGLNDSELPAILEAASKAGATNAGYTLLRLPLAVGPVFLDWMTRNRPNEAGKVETLIRRARGGRLNDSRFGDRFRGEGERAEQIRATFKLFARRFRLDQPLVDYDFRLFERPSDQLGQRKLF
ncbi:MAG: PA0069 family radical SAM protein [Planctomycetota bacterium]|nr:PA0069 family radical SAM protein [Planctomycetaceae bacterium]MDQ3332303.1 PA0069 family radical SAM protein [Planctomycetota bacterium]